MITDSSRLNEFPPYGAWAPLNRQGEDLGDGEGTWFRAAAPLQLKEPSEGVLASD